MLTYQRLCIPTAKDAPRAVRTFSRAFFFRGPLEEEVPQFAAALAATRRHWPWVLTGYLAFVALLVVPGLLRERPLAYHVAAVVLPHVMLYLVAITVAYAWIGFRINLSNFSQFVPQFRQQQRKVRMLLLGALSGAAGAVVGYNVGGMSEGSFIRGVVDAVGGWITDTFSPWVIALLFFVLIVAIPELIAQLRQRSHELATRLGEAEAVKERMARATAESELRLLQAQVEPHFLYNTLANLRFLVQSGSPDALKMTDALIEYLRTSVPDMRAQHVTLGREVDHARHYLEIMQMRMGGRLRYAVEVPAELREVPLPPLALLTVVENAVKHGVGPLVEGGTVTIRARTAGEHGELVEIDVEDDGVGVAQAKLASAAANAPSTGTGLANVYNRFGLVYGERASMSLAPLTDDGRGTRARLRFPATMPAQQDPRPKIVVVPREQGERLLSGLAAPVQPQSSPAATSSDPAPR